MKRVAFFLAAVSGTIFVLSAPANGQDYISATVQSVVQQQFEAACQRGVPASAEVTEWAISTSQSSLDAYMSLKAPVDKKALRKVFAMHEKDVSWKDADGTLPIEQIEPKLSASKPELTLLGFVVAGDGMTAKGLWRATWSDFPDKPAYYAVDFSGSPKSWFTGRPFRVWHMTIFNEEPSRPQAYCHYNVTTPW